MQHCLLDRLRERLEASTCGASKGDHREPFAIALLDQAKDPLVSGALDPHGLFRSAVGAIEHQVGGLPRAEVSASALRRAASRRESSAVRSSNSPFTRTA